MGKRSSLHKDQYAAKNSYGFTAIWTQIYFQKKIYQIRSSARGNHQKSPKSRLRTLHDVFKDVIEGFFCCQKSYGNTIRMKNSATIKKKSVPLQE